MKSRRFDFIDRNWFGLACVAIIVTVGVARWACLLPAVDEETPALLDQEAARRAGFFGQAESAPEQIMTTWPEPDARDVQASPS